MKRRPASDASTSAGEALDIGEGQQGIEPGHVMPQRGNGDDAIRRRAHGDGEGVHRMLLVRQVDLGRRVLVEAVVLDVADDADDRLRSIARLARELRADPNLLSNGVLSREKSLCGPFVDEDDLRTRRRITSVEWPAVADRDPHRLEVVRADDPHGGRRHRCRVGLRLAFVTEAGYDVEIACEGKARSPPPPIQHRVPPPVARAAPTRTRRGLAGSGYLAAGNDRLNVVTPSDRSQARHAGAERSCE